MFTYGENQGPGLGCTDRPGTAATPPTGPRVRLDRDQRRLTLLDAAAAAFADRGFQATSMEEIASLAGVTRLIVYRHFDSKEDLYRAVLDRAVTSLIVAVRVEIEAGPSVEGVVKGFLDAGRAYPDGFRLLVRQAAATNRTLRTTWSGSDPTPCERPRS